MRAQHRLYQRGKTGLWWVDFGTIGGVRHKRTTGTTDRLQAEKVAEKVAQELRRHSEAERLTKLTLAEAAPEWAQQIASATGQKVVERLLKNAKSRAQQAGLVWALSEKDFAALVGASNGRCAVTGLPFALTEETRHPFKPSIDRIDNATGYSIGNCRLVLMAVNYAMNVWGDELFRTIALSYAASELRASVQRRPN